MSAFAQFEQKVRELVDAGLSALVKRLENLEQGCADGAAVDDELAKIHARLDALESPATEAKSRTASAPRARSKSSE